MEPWNWKSQLSEPVKVVKYLKSIHIQYAISIYGATSESILKPLKTLQKKALRLITNAKWISHCEPLWKKAGALKFSDLHELACAKTAYKIVNKVAPAGITSIFQIKEDRSRRHEQFPHLKVPFARTTKSQNLPSYQIPRCWNSTPDSFSMISIDAFSNSFKKHKLEQYEQFKCDKSKCFSCSVG